MERFQKLLEDPHKYAREWKAKTGGKVMGYLCTYFPEELAYAAGVLPVRILSQYDVSGLSSRYLYDIVCPNARGLLAQGLNGSYDYLDGLGHGECCMNVRAVFASWHSHVRIPYEHFVSMPSFVDDPRAKAMLRSELSAFKKSLEAWTGKNITTQALDHAIEVYNTSRSLMRQVYELRRADKPRVSGTEAMEMVLSSQLMDKEEHNSLLRDAMANLPQRKDRGNPGVRLMFLGSEVSDTRLIRLIESAGATVVIDELCNSSNYIWNNVIPQEDRLLAIALRYLDRPRCPMKDVRARRRVSHIMGLVEDYNARGVVLAVQKFCHPHQYDRPSIEEALRERNIPLHNIEYDGTVPTGEFQTRIEAFVDICRPSLI